MPILPVLALLAATAGDWRADVDQLAADLRALHPAPFTKTGELTFRRRVAALQDSLPAMTDEQRVVAAMQLVASIGDGHTQLEVDRPEFASWYPVRIYEFTDGIFVTSAHVSVRELAGAQLLEVAGRPAAEVLDSARSLRGADNTLDRRERVCAFHNAPLMRGLGIAGAEGRLRVRVRLAGGAVVERVLAPHASKDPSFGWRFRREMFGLFGTSDEWISAFRGLPASAFERPDWSRPPHLARARRFSAAALKEHDAYYVQAHQIDGDELVPMFRKAMTEVDALQPRRLILDLRHNFGGDGSVLTGFVHELVRREGARPWKELYLLTGRKTFSAGVMAVDALLDHTAVTVVGEPAGAALNHFGDAVERRYPRTGLRLYVSTLRHQLSNSSDVAEFIRVDVPAPFSFADYAAGRDPAVDPILRGDEMRSLPIIATTDGGAAARAAHARAARFAKFAWWTPPRELDLRVACSQLLEQSRVADALETCRLNTEIHPWIWNVWLNLSRVQHTAGDAAGRLRSLRRVLEIDPMNFNASWIRETLDRGMRPAVIRYGATLKEIEEAVAPLCTKTINTRRIEPPFLPNVKTRQMQVDCDGFLFVGKPRWAEFVFRDDLLEMVWIMTTPEEELAIREAMTGIYGAPSDENALYVAFTQGRIALRRKPAEVLFYSEGVAGHMEGKFKP
jgi:hypothetical protein